MTPILNRVVRDRLPLAVAVAAVLFAMATAIDSSFHHFPFIRPQGWVSTLLACLELGYLVAASAAGVLAVVQAVSTRERHASGRVTGGAHGGGAAGAGDATSAATGAGQALPELERLRLGRVSVPRDVAVGALLALVVVLETVLHFGPHSGSWVTSIPTEEADLTRADGHVLWLEGQPIQEDATRFITDVDVFAGGPGLQFPPRFPYNVVQTTRATYSYLVALLARDTGALGSIYLAFLIINVGLWWGASLAVYDLARHARRSAWAGLAAGLLTATGLGFTFMVGNPMSNAASYAGVALIPWLLWRMGFARAETPLSSDVVTASLTACAGLLYGMSAVFLLFAALLYLGRRSPWRLLYWLIAVLAVGINWETLNAWDRAPYRVVTPPSIGEWLAALALAGMVIVPLLVDRWVARVRRLTGGRRSERGKFALKWLALGASLVGALLCGACLAVPASRARLAVEVPEVVAAFQLPGHELESHFLHLSLGSVQGVNPAVFLVEFTRTAGLDTDVSSAFPAATIAVALIGLLSLPRFWREWSVALLCATTFVAFVLIMASHASHPRLVYWAFPAVYVLAASGLLNSFLLTRRLLSRASSVPRWLPSAVACAIAMSLTAAVLYPAHASLFGNWAYEARFHFGGF